MPAAVRSRQRVRRHWQSLRYLGGDAGTPAILRALREESEAKGSHGGHPRAAIGFKSSFI